MFDDVLRELRRLEQGITISIELPLDDDGYLDRKCPSEVCAHEFKVLFDDWRDKVPDERAFCPFCGHEDDPQDWNNAEQQEYIEKKGIQHLSGILDKAFESDARRFNRQQRMRPRGEVIDISMSMQYKPDAPILAVPPAAAEALRQRFKCDKCECRWSSLGASFFCSACGHNSVETAFATTLSTVREFLGSIPSLRTSLGEAVGVDAAETTIRQLVEDQFARIVGAFESYSEALFDELPSASNHPKKGSVFQRIPDASDLWRAAGGKGYDDFLSAQELTQLALFVQQRHVLGHNQGVVDQKYIDRSGDTRYRPGQRLVIRAEHVLSLVELAEKLGRELRLHVDTLKP